MDILAKINALDSCFIPAEMHTITSEEVCLVESILELREVTTKEQLIEIRNAVVNYYHPITDYLRKMYSTRSDRVESKMISQKYDVVSDKFSAIIGVIDEVISWRGWMQ